MAFVQSGDLWSCHGIGINAAGGSSSADRTGCEWLRFQVVTNGSIITLSLRDYGRVYDSTAAKMFYYMPSLVVNSRNDVLMGFSGSSLSVFPSAYFAGRLGTDASGTMRAIRLVHSGDSQVSSLSNDGRFGDYSYSSLDPVDGLTMWTIQEFGDATASYPNWGTWIWGVSPF